MNLPSHAQIVIVGGGIAGCSTGCKQCGSVNVARAPERMKALKKQTNRSRAGRVMRGMICSWRNAWRRGSHC